MRYPHDHENDIIYFGKVNFRNKMQTFGIKTDDRRRHVYIIGKTGVGKTTLMENMILSDIYAGHGCCYIDPHGDTAEKLLDYIPSWRINDVVYFNPADFDYPIAFNILEAVDEKMKHLVVAGMMSVFKKIWEGVWSARMEYILNNTILALMDNPNTTLLGINRMLSDADYRKEIVSNVKDPIVKQFWIIEFEGYQSKFASEAVAPIQNKVGQFLSAGLIRNIVAQAKSSINIRAIMDDQKIFIVNLAKGRIGEDSSRLLGGLLITKLQMSAMERVDILESERQDFYMYVDEFQNFAVESFASILSEARKYRLNLVMAHQYIEQLTEEVRDAVFGNVGTLIAFRVGGPDASFMEEEFMPRFTPNDMINLPKYHIYLKLMIDGITSQPFSAVTLSPIATRTGSEQKVIQQSRERYAGSRVKIEEKVSEWSGFGAGVDIDAEYEKSKQVKKDAKKARFSHEYTCTRCQKVFSLPVELDRSRPIYCEDCHPIVMEERKSGKGRAEQSKANREETKRVVDKVPKIDDGEIIQSKPVGTLKLEELSAKKEEVKQVEQKPELEKPKQEKESEIKAGDMLRVAPSPESAIHEPVEVVSKAPVVLEVQRRDLAVGQGQGQSQVSDQAPAKRKRRKRNRKKKPEGEQVQQPSVPITKPVVDASPKPVLPGEKVMFE
ncbi:type IV secretion system DNA-binding domain-containing protein [Patescibacteria group bacterium]|nr:type IV secretion system DNA-binding domain-containing protein [Patescibacteria group bacterium]MBU4452881.1 type IV secretion system DNA-binding domain-containing protein [Patescibacteria group bacterium]